MGWLRDMMGSAHQPIGSFGKLAALCLDHEGWPQELQPKPRSLSTLFSKLDRGKDLDWLRDRIEVQRVLAQLLKRPLGDLRAALGEVPHEEGGRFVRLLDARYARELDLSQEDLPPGIPTEAWTPQLWEPTWWHAPSGSGRTLVAAWLKSRGLAHSIQINDRDDLNRAPSRGALFIEMGPGLDATRLALNLADLEKLRAEQRPLCIAAPFPAPLPSLAQLTSPSITHYLPELVDWLFERLDHSGHFHPDRVENWMRKVAIPAGAVNNFGDALGLLGMADEVHPRSLLAKSLDEVAEHYVKRRVREASEATNTGPRIAETAFVALQECAARVLVSGEEALQSSHLLDEWTALLASPTSDDTPDPEWFTQALRSTLGAQVSRRDLRRAAKKLPPSAFQLTKSLEAAGLLVRAPQVKDRDEEGARRTLHPRWLVSLLTSRANQEALRLSPSQWGRVLLSGKNPDAILEALLSAMTQGDFKASFAVLDDYETDHPEMLAACEATVIAAGLSLLDGSEELPDELVEGLLHHVAEDIIVIDEAPEPRLTRSSCRLYQRDVYLAALASLCAHSRFPLPQLDPFHSSDRKLRRHFQRAIIRVLQKAPAGSRRCVELIKLLDGLFPESSDERAASLRFADTVLKPDAELFAETVQETGLENLLVYVESSERSTSSFERGVWKLLVQHPDPDSLFVDNDRARNFWRKAHGSQLVQRVHAGLSVNWTALLPHQFAEWFSAKNAPPLPTQAGDSCPIDAALHYCKTVGAMSIPAPTLAVLMSRGAARFSPLLTTYLSQANLLEAAHLLDNTPSNATASFARTFPPAQELLELPGESIQLVRRFFLRACRERHPDFDECYMRLTTLEKGLRPLRKLS